LWRNLLSDEGRNIAKKAERAQEAGDYRLARELYLKAITKFQQASDISGDFNEINVLRSLVSYYNERVCSIEQELRNDPVMDSQVLAPAKKDTTRVDVTELLRGSGVQEAVFEAVLGIAMEISMEGREGHAIGTAFMVGDSANVMARSRQLVLNPFEGHRRDKMKLTDTDIRDNIKEFAQVRIPGGLGTRHSSIAAITEATNAIGIVVSQSGGIIRIFRSGKIAATIKP
jgi:DNA integrity scanning protein DisA with diadenylate cyclase activity